MFPDWLIILIGIIAAIVLTQIQCNGYRSNDIWEGTYQKTKKE